MDEYLILLPDDEEAWERLDDQARTEAYGRHREFARRLEREGHIITGGAELESSRTARTVRLVNGSPQVSDGPATDAAEQLSGFYLVQTEDPDALAAACGLLAGTSPVEIRRIARTEAD